jgi:hypothetical protein
MTSKVVTYWSAYPPYIQISLCDEHAAHPPEDVPSLGRVSYGLHEGTCAACGDREKSTIAYHVNMIDSDTPATWMGLPCVVRLTPGPQDSGRCGYTVETTDPTALEAALDADDDVIEYAEE